MSDELRALLRPDRVPADGPSDGLPGGGDPLDDEALEALLAHDGGLVRAALVASVDGRVAAGGSSRLLSSPADLRVLRTLRGLADVVLVGAGTARSEGYGVLPVGPGATGRRRGRGQQERPALALVTASCDLDPDGPPVAARLSDDEASRAHPRPPLVLTCDAAPLGRRRTLARVAEVVVVGDAEVDVAAVLDALGERGLNRVLCEGGPRLLGDLVAAGALDELCLTTSWTLGGDPVAALPARVSPDLRPARPLAVLLGDGALTTRWSLRTHTATTTTATSDGQR